jgi:tetratricopeptide (TPR) repeat protein
MKTGAVVTSRSAALSRVAAGLLIAVWFALPAGAATCVGAEKELAAAGEAVSSSQWKEAERLFRKIQTTQPDCHPAVLGLGRALAANGDKAAAEELLSRYVELEPTDARAYYYLAQFFFSQGAFSRADVPSELAAAFGPDDPDILSLRAQMLLMKGAIAKAEKMAEKACELGPKNREAQFVLGSIFDAQKRNPEAVAQFRKVIDLDPKDARAYDFLALNLEPMGEMEKVEAAYKTGIRVDQEGKQDAYLDYNYGRFLAKLNRLAEARKHLDRAVALAPDTRAVYYERAKVSFRMGKYQDARQDAERASGLPDPANVILDLQVYYLLSQIYSQLGENELAQKYVELSKKSSVPVQSQGRR